MVDRKSTTPVAGKGKVNITVELDAANDESSVRRKLQDVEVLSLADDQDAGGDPYNNTGQYCRLPKTDEE